MPLRPVALTAQQIIESYDLNDNESSDDEIDLIEKRIDTSEDEANSSFDEELGEDSFLTSLPTSTTEILNFDTRNIVYCRETKKKSSKSIPPFQWFDSPDSFYCGETNKYDSKIIEELKEEKSMHIFYKNIITDEMITLIVEYTNLRISRIDTRKILNQVYRKQFERLISKKIKIVEMYVFVGLLIIFGLTGKTDISIEEIWSERSIHYYQLACVTKSRERLQLISRNTCFDNILTRDSRKSNKFHKIADIFKLFKENIKMIEPSFRLCVDETLYQFRGKCFCRQFIP
jgi:hypothetical protein